MFFRFITNGRLIQKTVTLQIASTVRWLDINREDFPILFVWWSFLKSDHNTVAAICSWSSPFSRVVANRRDWDFSDFPYNLCGEKIPVQSHRRDAMRCDAMRRTSAVNTTHLFFLLHLSGWPSTTDNNNTQQSILTEQQQRPILISIQIIWSFLRNGFCCCSIRIDCSAAHRAQYPRKIVQCLLTVS